jgi:hypothetical protein
LRLAIMPFTTGCSVPEHLGPAIAEETTASLSSERQFAVAVLARDSVFNLAQRGLTAQQIGLKLKADLVLTGTLRASSSHYRLRAEMIRVEDGTQIWVEDLLTPRSQDRRTGAGADTSAVLSLVHRGPRRRIFVAGAVHRRAWQRCFIVGGQLD